MSRLDQSLDATVAEYYERHANDDGQCPIASVVGWEIEKHAGGLCLLSPGCCCEELGYRDDSGKNIARSFRECGIG